MPRRSRWSCVLLVLLCASRTARAQETVPLSLSEFSLELRASWEPLVDTVYGFEHKYPQLRALAPAAERASYGAERFRPFLPAALVAVGDSWRVEAAAALPFLRQLHPGATHELHHDFGQGLAAHGAWACLRSLDETHAEVLLRVHAEFRHQGDGKGEPSWWLTPAQFRGRMVIDRRSGQVVAFELRVPEQSANVDVNVSAGEGFIADIGRIPRMELSGGAFPAPAAPAATGTCISEREAEDILARRFYPFAEIEWLDLPAARAESRASGKPLHVLALFGSLTDESC